MTMPPPFHRILATAVICLAAGAGLFFVFSDSESYITSETAIRVDSYTNEETVAWEALTQQNVNNSILLCEETGRTSYTPLLIAISHGHVNGVRKCLELGADTEKRVQTMSHELLPGSKAIFQCVEGYTPLHLAVYLKQYKIVEMLLEAGADIEGAVGPDGRTPLMSAAYWGDEEMVRLLLNKGANAQAKAGGEWCLEEMYKGKTALDFARNGGHADCIELLIAYNEKNERE